MISCHGSGVVPHAFPEDSFTSGIFICAAKLSVEVRVLSLLPVNKKYAVSFFLSFFEKQFWL